MTAELITLASGNLELTLSPSAGGSIARFDHVDGEQRIAVLRGCDGAPSHALGAASFPLVPFVNRVRDGGFTFRGRDIRLSLNMAGEASPIHGQGWINPWTVTSSDATSATLEFEHEPGDWPWAYLARQAFTLDEAGLTIDLSCRNLSPDPMPCGLGQHPYFHCTSDTRLATNVDHVWTIDEQVLPVDRVPATGRFDLTDRPVCGLGLDHGFGGWGGTALVGRPDWPFGLSMSSPGTDFFQLYSPMAGGIFVIEPTTHANAALNAPEEQWPDLGLQILGRGEAMRMSMRISLTKGRVSL